MRCGRPAEHIERFRFRNAIWACVELVLQFFCDRGLTCPDSVAAPNILMCCCVLKCALCADCYNVNVRYLAEKKRKNGKQSLASVSTVSRSYKYILHCRLHYRCRLPTSRTLPIGAQAHAAGTYGWYLYECVMFADIYLSTQKQTNQIMRNALNFR